MERYIAIDNVCAWPNLTLMPDGSIMATIFNQPVHGDWEGDVECWLSEDDGRTWTLRGVPAPHEPGTNRLHCAAGLAHNGDFIVLATGLNRRSLVGEPNPSHRDGELLSPWVCRSTDAGRTWARSESVEISKSGPTRIAPFGDIYSLDDGALGVCLYGGSRSGDHTSSFYCSLDDGLSWQLRGTIGEKNYNETAAAVLPDGRLLAAVRTLDDRHLQLFESDDNGRSWQDRDRLTLGQQIPGHLLLLSDGRLLVTYGVRNIGYYGVAGRISDNQGRTWTPPRFLAHLDIATDGGYPSSVQIHDDTIVTAYYCNKISSHQRYHMGVIRFRWQPDLQLPKFR